MTTVAASGPVREVVIDPARLVDPSLEWLVTNGLGGYAAGLVGGGLSRRFHGLLIAALPAPIGRVTCCNLMRTTAHVGDSSWILEDEFEAHPASNRAVLSAFRLESGLPIWRYTAGSAVIERRLVMTAERNTTHLQWRLVEAYEPVALLLEPAFQMRPHEGALSTEPPSPEIATMDPNVFAFAFGPGWPTVSFRFEGATAGLTIRPADTKVNYGEERRRGYESTGGLKSAGLFDLHWPEPGSSIWLSLTTEPMAEAFANTAQEAYTAETRRRTTLVSRAPDPLAAELFLAADQFIVTPVVRAGEVDRAHEAGETPRTVIAGYPWFTDWGRDTMIGLEGLTLATGRTKEAARILRTFGHYVHHGLIPNLFPEGARLGLYHSADATLWFFHTIERYRRRTKDARLVDELLPAMTAIAESHLEGTDFGIGVDPADQLLHQGAPGYPLTWMDAKLGDWVVTPRRGKAVEINALWYNAMRLLAGWLDERGRSAEAQPWRDRAATTRESFNTRFWNPVTGHLFDVVDGEKGDDPSCRPNQIFALSLDHPVLDPARGPAVVDAVRSKLLTPVGLRSLAPDDPNYQPKYDGDLSARDAAYHQGTVWAWLIGPYVDAWLRVHPHDRQEPMKLLDAFSVEMSRNCIGSISEIFDAEPPFAPRGCVSQAWSVAEVLRAWRRLGMLEPDDNGM